MAQRAVAALLRRTLDSWAEEAELDAQVLSGQTHLTGAKLRPLALPGGFSLTGSLGSASSSWSWRSLLSSPVKVSVRDVCLVVRPDPEATGTPWTAPDALDNRELNFLQRWMRRIWDQLEVEVENIDIRLEMPTSRDTMSKGDSGIGAIGLCVSKWAVTADKESESDSALHQVVSITDVGIYVSSSPCHESTAPPENHFLTRGLSPHCRAIRRAGRRFVDWRGLEVRLGVEKSEFSWNTQTYLGLARLVPALQKHWEQHSTSPVNESQETAETAAQPATTAAWLASWFSVSGPGQDLPDFVSGDDQALLLKEDAPPAAADTFELDLQVGDLQVGDKAMLLELSYSFHLMYSLDGWKLDFSLGRHCLSERTEGGLEPVITRGAGGGQGDKPQLLLSATSKEKLEVSLNVAPLSARITQTWISTIREMVTTERAMKVTSFFEGDLATRIDQAYEGACSLLDACSPPATQATPASSSGPLPSERPWALVWTADEVCVSVGDPWLPGAQLLVTAALEGTAGSSGTCSAGIVLDSMLEDEGGQRRILERTSIFSGFEDGKAFASCPRLAANCQLHELVALVRAGRALEAAFPEAFDGGAAFTGPPARAWEVRVEEVAVQLTEEGAAYHLKLRNLCTNFAGSSCTAVADPCEVLVRVGDRDRALLRLDGLSACCNFKSICNSSAQAAVDLRDCWDQRGAETVALLCPSLQVALSLDFTKPELLAVALEVQVASVLVDSSEEFVTACTSGLTYISDVVTSCFAEVVVFKERPLGLHISDAKVQGVSGVAQRLGVLPGSTLYGMDCQPTDGKALDALKVCQLPVTLLLVPPPQRLQADVSIAPFTLSASLKAKQRAIEMNVERAILKFGGCQISAWEGNAEELGEKVKAFYVKSLMKELPRFMTATSIGGQRLSQTAAGAVGSGLALLHSSTATAGAVGSTLAKGATTLAAAATKKSRDSRGGEDNSYRFGDLSRGLILLSCERGRRFRGSFDDRPERERSFASKAADAAAGSMAGAAAYVHNTRAVSSTVGAALGGSLGAVAGPAGSFAGAAGGGAAMANLSRKVESASSLVGKTVSAALDKGKESRTAESGGGYPGYRIGDLARGVAAAGRESRGGETQGDYKLGDFSRGLLSKLGKK